MFDNRVANFFFKSQIRLKLAEGSFPALSDFFLHQTLRWCNWSRVFEWKRKCQRFLRDLMVDRNSICLLSQAWNGRLLLSLDLQMDNFHHDLIPWFFFDLILRSLIKEFSRGDSRAKFLWNFPIEFWKMEIAIKLFLRRSKSNFGKKEAIKSSMQAADRRR